MNQVSAHHENPTLRIHQSSPAPPISQSKPMLAQSPFVGGGWGSEGFPGANYLNANSRLPQNARYHKRASSGSSIASQGPPSPLDHTTLYPHIATTDNFSPHYENLDFLHTPQSAQSSKSLPIPTSDAFMYQNQYGAIDMRRIQSTGADEAASYAMSAAPSVSSLGHNSPATPHTNIDYNEYEESRFYGENNKMCSWVDEYLQFEPGYPQHTPAYYQSMQDVFPDQNAALAYQQQQMRQLQQRPTMIASRVQATQAGHLQPTSPMTSSPRDKSPFRQTSRLNEQIRPPIQVQQPLPHLQKIRSSVSPKELQLNHNDVEDTPSLFGHEQQSIFADRRNGSHMANYYPPNFSSEPSLQIPQHYPFVSQSSRQESGQSFKQDQTPEFPAHLTSMESTVEESSEPPSQQSTQEQKTQLTRPPVGRPKDTSSDAGTYSCTYHGCMLRFDSPAKLQKHKREAHRQTSPGSPSSLALRNSQAGPHECKRTNPSTGKPCNSVFSRPYDLTRHEDTIHNGRKHKVRCHLCTEEKTFSRNDALTRHMRVVHPDVDWPGKQKRRAPK